jgi:hypothetical protein
MRHKKKKTYLTLSSSQFDPQQTCVSRMSSRGIAFAAICRRDARDTPNVVPGAFVLEHATRIFNGSLIQIKARYRRATQSAKPRCFPP